MTLLGLSLQQLALAFGAAGAAITLLYMLKLQRRRVQVPFAKLWERVLKERESTSLFRRLKRWLSLLVQLCFLFLLTAALGDPRLSATVLEGRHVILLMDTSASMKASEGSQGTRMATAVAEAKRIVRGMNGADALMIVRMDAQVTPLSPFQSDEKALLKVLDGLTAVDTRADLLRALRLCGDALRQHKNPMLIVVSDGAFPAHLLDSVLLDEKSGQLVPGPRPERGRPTDELAQVDLRGIAVRYLPIGHSGDNVGIVAFNARRYARNKLSFEVFLEVINYRRQASEVDLQLLADGQVIDVQRLKLQGGETARYTCDPDERRGPHKAWCDLGLTGELLEARLVMPRSKERPPATVDAFAPDDRAYALLPERQKQRVLLVTRGNLYLEGALLLEPALEVTKISPARYTPSLAERVDAVVFDGYFPPQPPGRHALVLNAPAGAGPFRTRERLRAPLITEQERKHPVMRWVTLKDINITEATSFSAEPGVTVLAASFQQPVIVAKVTAGVKMVAFGFDLTRSDLPLRVAFPILVLNSLDWFAGDGNDLVTSYRTGESWSVPLPRRAPSATATVRVTDPQGQIYLAPVHDGRVLLYGNLTGLYTLELGGARVRLAANLADAVESAIQPRRTLTLGGRQLAPPTGFGLALRREIWLYLLLAALGLTLVEWLTYNRRITV